MTGTLRGVSNKHCLLFFFINPCRELGRPSEIPADGKKESTGDIHRNRVDLCVRQDQQAGGSGGVCVRT